MRELCPTHKLVIAPDGKCVLCRRPPLRLFAVREEHEDAISKVFTALLGVGLTAAAAALIYVSTLDAGYTGGRYVPGPTLGKLSGQGKAAQDEQPQPEGELAANAAADAQVAQEPEEAPDREEARHAEGE